MLFSLSRSLCFLYVEVEILKTDVYLIEVRKFWFYCSHFADRLPLCFLPFKKNELRNAGFEEGTCSSVKQDGG